MKNLFAHTASGANYPAYISVNEGDYGDVMITVRSGAYELGVCGPTADICLTKEQAEELGRALLSKVPWAG